MDEHEGSIGGAVSRWGRGRMGIKFAWIPYVLTCEGVGVMALEFTVGRRAVIKECQASAVHQIHHTAFVQL